MALATFEQIKDFLELKKSAITDYPALGVLLKANQSQFESYTLRLFDLKTHTQTFRVTDPDGESSLWLKGTPIQSITSITVTNTSGDDTSLEVNDDYYFDTQRIELLSAAVQGEVIVVEYTGGLVDQTSETTLLDTLPPDLNIAAIRQISYEFQNRSRLAVESVALDGNVTKYPKYNLLAYVQGTLDDYKNWGTGF